MSDIHPNEAAIVAERLPEDAVPQDVRLVIDLRVLNERLLRRIAADRMARGGFEPDPAKHEGAPLHELAYEAIFGSAPDPLAPADMGIEIVRVESTSAVG
jgi:hypothetical protein